MQMSNENDSHLNLPRTIHGTWRRSSLPESDFSLIDRPDIFKRLIEKYKHISVSDWMQFHNNLGLSYASWKKEAL